MKPSDLLSFFKKKVITRPRRHPDVCPKKSGLLRKIGEQLQKNKIVIYLMTLAIFGYLSKYAFNLILTHYLKPSLFGDFNIAQRILGILATLSLLGTNTSSKLFLSNYLQDRHDINIQSYIKWNTKIIRIPFAICIIIAISSFAIMHMLHIWHVKDIRTYHLTIYMLWIAPIASMLTLLNTYLLCANYPVSYAFVANSSNFFSMVFFLILLVFYEAHEITSFKLFIILSFGLLSLLIVDIILLMKKTPYLFNLIARALTTKHKHLIEPTWLNMSSRLAINGLFCSLIFTIDLFILKLISPHPESVGYYAVTLTIASSLFVIPQNIYITIKAKVNYLLATNEGKKQLEMNIKALNRFAVIFTLLLGYCILYYSKTLLHHFGVSYVQAYPILQILVFGFIIGTFAQPAKTILAYSGQVKGLLFISITELSFMLILCTTLTYLYDIKGIAIATSLSMIVRTLLFHIVSYRHTQFRSYIL